MRWSYKTVHYELRKEGLLGSAFLDESEVEESLNILGQAGWELVSLLEVKDGIIAVFKQPLSLRKNVMSQEEYFVDDLLTETEDDHEETYPPEISQDEGIEIDEESVEEGEAYENDAEYEQEQPEVGNIRIE